MGKEVRSIRYFDGLFMKAEEFIQEQNYHNRMRRLHNRYLHSSGIVWGLEILKSKKPGSNPADITVTKGMALNKVEEDGEEVSKEIILTDDTDVSLSSIGAGKTVYIYISYSKEAAPKNSEDSKNIHWLEEGKLGREVDRNKIDEDDNVLLGKVSLISANGTVTVDKIDYVEGGGSLRKYAGFSGKSLQTEKIFLAIDGVTSGFASIEGKQTGVNKGIHVNSPITSFAGALSIGDTLGVGGNIQLPDNKSLVLGTTNPVSLHNSSAASELWLEATGQASSSLVIGTAFDPDKQVKVKYAPGAVGAAAGELRIGQDVKLAGAFTHGITTLYTNGAERLRINAAGNVGIGTPNPGYRLDLANGTIGYGLANTRTETRTDAGLQGNVGAQSGFFQNDSSTVKNYPAGASGWWHLIDVRHSNPANNYALQIAGSFFDQELYFRKTNNNPSMPWNKLIYQSNDGNVIIRAGNLKIPDLDTFLDFGADTRQMINLYGNGPNAAYGIGVQGWTQYYRSAGNFAWYIGGTHSDVELDPGSGGSPVMIIKRGSGNIGIGTMNPQSRLQVKNLTAIDESGGYANFGSNAFFDGAWKRIDTTKAGVNLHMNGDGAGQEFRFYRVEADGSKARNIGVIGSVASFIAEGNVGIGTVAPGTKLEVNLQNPKGWGGPLEAVRINSPDNRYWMDLRTHVIAGGNVGYSFRTRNEAGAIADALTIDTFGKVGIGTAGPAYKLDVAGDIHANRVFLGGKWMLSGIGDAHGNDDWLRFFNINNTGYYGGIAVNKLWVNGDIIWNGGVCSLSTDQGGSIELGNSKLKGTIPYIDFHFGIGHDEDYNARIINIANGELYLDANSVTYKNYIAKRSSRELKENISDISVQEAFETLETLNPVKYHLKADKEKRTCLGFIAEDLHELAVTPDRKAVLIDHIVAMLTKIIKEQQKKITVLMEKVNA